LLFVQQVRDRLRTFAQLVVLADLGLAADAVALHARQPEGLAELLVVLVLGGGQHVVHVLGVVLAELKGVGNRQLGIEDGTAGEREQHAETLIRRVRALRGEHVQVLGQDLRPRDPPFIVRLGGRDLLFRLGLPERGLRLPVLPDRRGHQPGHADDEGRQKARIVLNELSQARGMDTSCLGDSGSSLMGGA
jgi:hypothetical protein